MKIKKIIRTEDPDDIKSGFAATVWDIVKMSSLIAGGVGFASAFLVLNKFFTMAEGGWTDALWVCAVIFVLLFAGLWYPVRETVALARKKDEDKVCHDVPDSALVSVVLPQYAFTFSTVFFFLVTVDYTTMLLNPYIVGDKLLDYPGAIFFFYGVAPAVICNVLFGGFQRSRVKKLFRYEA
ncbi:hypothetical protein [Sutterella sp.]|uniref:hypothetical protein n=1 Tax=Sutterella sp. TaxID=1981025 RepID=UPI0026DF4B54|nr:hypothetical protein [Sutterella sp.]MDO5531223.1 hypothetical protein [Sutterella sp.]